MDKSKNVFHSTLDKFREKKSLRKRIKNTINENEDNNCNCCIENCSVATKEIKTNDVSVK